MALLMSLVIGLCAFGYTLLSGFTISALEPSENRLALTVVNGERPALRSIWVATSATPMVYYTAFCGHGTASESRPDHVVTGTIWGSEDDGAITLYSARGHVLWTYSIPHGECIYNGHSEAHDGFDVSGLVVHDLDGDGVNEILATFSHHYAHSSKLVILSLNGKVLAEYWHPGRITHIAAGHVGRRTESLVVLTARNVSLTQYVPNRIAAEAVFAFSAERISGQGPVYTGRGEAGTELWYRIVADTGLQSHAAIAGVHLEDIDGDGDNEIRLMLDDGRLYFLNEAGNVVGAATSETWFEAYGQLPIPSLMALALRSGGAGAGLEPLGE
ncbi:MAG: hypothetical protein AB1778_03495 [Candidatus Bipolaricaulota bacterium]